MDVPDLAGVLVPSSNACKKYAVEVSNGVDAERSGMSGGATGARCGAGFGYVGQA